MRIALCNEVVREMDFATQCAFAAALGYDGLELAPFTLGEEPHLMTAADRARIRRTAADAGLAIASLHWLLVTPEGLSITSADAAVRARTTDTMRRLVDLCADLGGTVLVHGSPAQRRFPPGEERAAWARECFTGAAEAAEARGVVYCIEPLSRRETGFLNTVVETAAMATAVGSPALRTMIDAAAAGATEAEALPALIGRWLPTGLVAHIQLNDTNRRGPGQGSDRFAPVLAALQRHAYTGWLTVEPFDYVPDGPAAAARAVGYIRGILEALDASSRAMRGGEEEKR